MTTTNNINKGLGKGLSALMGEEYSQHYQENNPQGQAEQSKSGMSDISIDAIHSSHFQPRTHFDEAYLHELADSIEQSGLMQPIIVRPSSQKPNAYEIIAGERRWRAAKLAKLHSIPAIIRDIDDKTALELALVENIQRQDLTAIEEASGYQRLIEEFKYTQEELAHTVGKSRSHITNLLRLLQLPEAVKTLVQEGKLSMGHARAILNAEHPETFAQAVIDRQLSVRQTEELVRKSLEQDGNISNELSAKTSTSSKTRSRRRSQDKDPDIIALEHTLSENLGLSVSINDYGNQQGDIIINYNSLSQLDEILRRLGDSI